jgi:glycosyltransferase involved in cell wall biosynthesis
MESLSVVSVSMNRTEQLLEAAQAVSRLHFHSEHVILDFGSLDPIRRNELPDDNRIKLHRVESPNGKWWLTHAYNLAFALAQGDCILKLDADILPSHDFMVRLCEQHAETKADLMCNRLTLQDWSLPSNLFTTNGLFLCKRSRLAELRGFNPYIQGWGWDEIDLYSRFFLAGFPSSRISQDGLDFIEHNNDVREPPILTTGVRLGGLPQATLDQVSATRRMQAQNEKNRQIAVASIKKQVKWPSLEDYRRAYLESSSLPSLSKVYLFDAKERQSLAAALRHQLLKPSRTENLFWRVAKKIGFGPYTHAGTQALLDACNIDLGLVA